MSDSNLKWVFTFTMIFITIAWAVFTVFIVRDVALKVNTNEIQQIDVIAVAGAGTLMGALIGWDTLIIQYWFRKKPGETNP